MSASAGVQGYETLTSALQQQRGALGRGLAPKPSATPAHLSRVLYIPPHGSSDLHLAVGADVSAEYKHAIRHARMDGSDVIGDAPMGSQLFMTRLGTMERPVVDADHGQARYVVDATLGDHGHVSATLRRCRGAGERGLSATISTADFQLTATHAIDVTASFPTTSSAGTTRHPLFTLKPHGGARRLQWQIDPRQDGPLRYTLVETRGEEEPCSEPKTIRAIYHHIRQGASLSMRSSEGVVLVPEDDGDETELLVVASLLGLLWRVRGLEVRPPPVDQAPHGGKPTFLQRLLGRK
ncbi:hypothetical protein HRG_000708 [Hirsutella rhossiliensis]|uniref:Uncharacterized protein n=1 Tax=Hirsutella rhossiliensis TaxID=111463 RepID=A0A9P8N8R5_9HYPO|nr:uncharacterized protein HRG_00708 [Hirsutella rhossiliensis]KAH0968066.1 hypothetical protein HRG_00708 [Hirsutella rhossiliensis]